MNGVSEVESVVMRHVSNRQPGREWFGAWVSTCTSRVFSLVFLLLASSAFAADDIDELRRQLAEQQALIQEQREHLQVQQQTLAEQEQHLDRQQEQLNQLTRRLDTIVPAASGSVAAVDTATTSGQPGTAKSAKRPGSIAARDHVGDLNHEAVRTGDFPGSFRIPGPGQVSLRLGGLVKAVAIEDSKAEQMGADFLPALLGTSRPDDNGAFSVDATLARVFLDARAPTEAGQIQGYIEADLNEKNDGELALHLRHAYGLWQNNYGTLLAGQTWSTMMDLKILPEGLTEPTVSGVIFQRQPMVRWSQPLPGAFKLDMAVENPNSNDLFKQPGDPSLANTRYPDIVLGLEYDRPDEWHLRLTGIVRELNVDDPEEGRDENQAWGVALTGQVKFLRKDRVMFSTVYGEALGRYLLGIQSTAGGAIEPGSGQISNKDNWGGMLAFEHHWSQDWRSTIMAGYAEAKPLDWQPAIPLKARYTVPST